MYVCRRLVKSATTNKYIINTSITLDKINSIIPLIVSDGSVNIEDWNVY